MITAFDADVLIYAARLGDPLGTRVAALLSADMHQPAGIGSVLLLPEVLTKPLREGSGSAEAAELIRILGRLELHPMNESTALLSVELGVAHGLRAADATHLATAVIAGADRFLTNNQKDFPKTIEEIEILYPDELPTV